MDLETFNVNFSYNPKTGVFNCKRTGKVIFGIPIKSGALQLSFEGKKYYLHRLAFLYMTGGIPKEIDHINGVTSDNRWCNLRPCTRAENIRNRKGWGKRKKGVFIQKNGKYASKIYSEGKSHFLGNFETEDEAHQAYIEASKLFHKDFARW